MVANSRSAVPSRSLLQSTLYTAFKVFLLSYAGLDSRRGCVDGSCEGSDAGNEACLEISDSVSEIPIMSDTLANDARSTDQLSILYSRLLVFPDSLKTKK